MPARQLGRRHRHDGAVADLELLTAEAALNELELDADIDAGLVPPDARRPLWPHERRAAVNFARIADEQGARARLIGDRLVAERAWLAGQLDQLLAAATSPAQALDRLAQLADPTRPLELDLPGVDARIATLEADVAGELRRSYGDGWAQQRAEAAAQGVPTRGITDVAITLEDDAAIAAQARAIAVRPAATGIDAANQAVARQPAATAAEARERAVDAARNDRLAGLRTDHAAAPVAGAGGRGRQAALDRLPTPANIYASELLDGSTCDPCSLVDGRDYGPDRDAARRDYPAGTYRLCEGGLRCRGTLVTVWNTEAAPTIDDAPRPGPEAPPTPPAPPPPDRIGPNLPSTPAPRARALTREEQLEADRQARLAARRARAQAERDAERNLLADLEKEGWTPAEIAAARRDVDEIRALARVEARRAAEDLAGQLAELTADNDRLIAPPAAKRVKDAGGRWTVRRYNPDGSVYEGGAWDWLERLDENELKRLRRKWFAPRGSGAPAPDELADLMRGRLDAAITDEEAMARWLDYTRRIDAADTYATGHVPSGRAYGPGATGLDELIPSSPIGTDIFADSVTATRRLLEHYADDAAELAARYGDEAVEAVVEGAERLGPAPWDMSERAFVDEVNRLDEVWRANPDPVVDYDEVLGRARYAPDVDEALQRLAELIPEEFEALDLAPADLHRTIVQWAREAGLRAEEFAA